MEESVFFGNEGLTSTSANYYCNIAQEMIQDALERLNSVKCYKVSIALLGGNGEKSLMTVGQSSINFINEDLYKVAEINSFCAWVREAIKKKEQMLSSIDNIELDEWAEKLDIKMPKYPAHVAAFSEITEEEVMNFWDINKRNKYLRFEAFASTYGKYIHPKGVFSKARRDAHEAENCPIYKEGSGRDLILYYQEPTVNVKEIDAMFMSLQDIYRSYEKELNNMKAELKETVNKINMEREEEYREKLALFKALNNQYEYEMQELRSRFNSWKTSEKERIALLKIVLPKSLLEIFEEIKKQGDSSK